MRLRLDVAYDGADFSGWAVQKDRRTVQGELEHWIATTLRLRSGVPLTCAGRTDAGVHARGQVCHVDLPDDLDPAALQRTPDGTDVATLLERRLARVLPPDVVVRRVTLAPPGFDARFGAIWRRYVYRLSPPGAARDPLARNHVVAWPDALDARAMAAAAPRLLGLRDFAAFCKPREGATTIRTLLELGTVARPDGVLETTVRADAFCHSMVRSLMGALVAIGSGQRDLAWLHAILTAGARATDVRVMPAHGLVLEEVGYPADVELAARAAESRATRRLEEPDADA